MTRNTVYDIRKDRGLFKHVGDIEQNCQVFEHDDHYLLYDNEIFFGYFFINKVQDRFRLRIAFITPEYREKNFFEYFIWFLIRHENVEDLEISNVQSAATEKAFEKLSYRMDLHWEKDGVKEPYDSAKVDKYYNTTKPTGWVIVIASEGATKAFEDFPRYFDLSTGHIGIFYEWLLNDVRVDVRVKK